ncbi:MAG: flavin reductase family protein [Armatimonadota bacterium]|jgi:flavin reductase (DIM6/NTAB) family NADH-FMN oxidoreductase RutF
MKQVHPGAAIDRKYPEWVILVVARDADGKPNLMPAGWGMVCSGEPRLVCVSVGLTRYTHRCIEDTGEFVFAWAGEGQAELVRYSGSRSGADCDKFAEYDIPTADPAVISVPLLAEAAANLECTLHSALRTGDHTIFVGEVVAAHAPEEPVATLMNFSGEFAPAAPVKRGE